LLNRSVADVAALLAFLSLGLSLWRGGKPPCSCRIETSSGTHTEASQIHIFYESLFRILLPSPGLPTHRPTPPPYPDRAVFLFLSFISICLFRLFIAFMTTGILAKTLTPAITHAMISMILIS